MRIGRWLCLSSGMALLALTATATSQSAAQARRDARLSYERKPGTEACQDESALRDAVAVRLGYDPFASNKGPLVHVIVRQADKGYRATIELKNESDVVIGTRQVASQHADCVELSSVVALTISMAIDPLADPRASATAQPAPPSTAPAPTAQPSVTAPAPTGHPSAAPPAVPSASPSSPPSSPQVDVYAGGGLALGGGAPAPAFGLLLGAEVTDGPFSLGVEGRVQFASSTAAAGTAVAPSGTTVSASLYGAALVGCLHYRISAHDLGGCVVPLVGSLHGSATLSRAQDQSSLFGALGLRAAYAYEWTKLFAFAVFAEALGTLTPTTFLFQKGTAWETAPISGTLGALLKVRFP